MHLLIHNRLAEIQRVAGIIAELEEKQSFPKELVHDAVLVLEEILSNIILHGYDDAGEHQIDVELRYSESEVELKIQDDAKAFNPLDVPEPDLDLPLEDRPIGGLGIYLARSLMDELNYTRVQGKNVLIVKKYSREKKGERCR